MSFFDFCWLSRWGAGVVRMVAGVVLLSMLFGGAWAAESQETLGAVAYTVQQEQAAKSDSEVQSLLGLVANEPATETILSFHEAVVSWLEGKIFWLQQNAVDLLLTGIGLLIGWGAAWILARVGMLLLVRSWTSHINPVYGKKIETSLRGPFFWTLFCGAAALSCMKICYAVSPAFETFVLRCWYAIAVVMVVRALFRMIDVLTAFLKERAAQSSNSMDLLLVALVRKTAQTLLMIVAILFIGQNIFKINITALIAGAGVLGLAIALAAQDSLANFFGSLMIMLDKPFTVGDRIHSGDIDGVVESVGFRSTKVRSLDGNLFQMPNKVLADGVIENVSRRPNIKYVFDVGLVYQTTPRQMQQAIDILKELVSHHEGFDIEKNPPLIHFTEFRDWALNITVVVWFNTNDFMQAQDWKSQLNLQILERFNAAGLGFAYPTATHFVATDPACPAEFSVKQTSESGR